MIRVFPRRTKWTPKDNLAFVGEPGLFRPPEQSVFISVTFTWDIPEAERLYRSWSRFYPDVRLGGPAFDDPGDEFISGRFLEEGVTITSRGCTKTCPWCLVPAREGWIREIPVTNGWIIQDNNLLACKEDHIRSVFGMLGRQPKPARLMGLDAELLQDWHIPLLESIRLSDMWLACDYPGAIKHIKKASTMLSGFNIRKKRCYVLIGFDGETTKQAEKRLEQVYQLGFLPFAMLYKSPDLQHSWNDEWKKLQRKWSRPAAYRSKNFCPTRSQASSQVENQEQSTRGVEK